MAHLNEDVALVVDSLIQFGVLSEAGCRRYADFLRSLQAFSAATNGHAGAASAAIARTGLGSAPAAGPARKGRKKRSRVRLTIGKGELAGLYQTMTAKAIAAKYGVSPATINLRLRTYKISKAGRAKSGRKKK